MAELVQDFSKLNIQQQQQQQLEIETVLNSFNYFCTFCLRQSLHDNKGNFAACQECGINGSNFSATCFSCQRPDQYVYWRMDFETGKGDSPAKAVCSKCTGATLWSGEALQVSGNCRLCLKETPHKDFGVLQECQDCYSICLPQSYLKTVVCPSCPDSVLQRQAEENERNNKVFLLRDGELKCEECWLHIVFTERVAKERQNKNKENATWQLPEEYSYYCIFCRKVSNWRNVQSGKYSQCTTCLNKGTNKKKRCKDCHQMNYLYVQSNQDELCAECSSGYGCKKVSDIVVLPCLFCDDTHQTFYIFKEKGKMKCTECQGLRPLYPPLIPDQCPTCLKFVERGMMTYSGISRCDECFRLQLAIGTQAKTAQMAIGSNQTYMHDCEFCVGEEKQVWINMGQFSECQGCKVIGTNSYDIQCQCGEYDYLFTKPDQEGEAMCSQCHKKSV